jgi:quercetin dioxygenase-like cupin family protein
MDKSGKIWGFTSKIFSKNNVEVHRIEGYEGGITSMHRHTAKWSMFFVEKGKIKIYIEKNDYPLTDKTILKERESIIIRPNEYHCFEIMEEGSVAYEIYWTELNPDDIERKNSGSI